jgi:hypothetical protein
VTYEGLLAVVAIVLAVYGLADSAKRVSLRRLARVRLVVIAAILSALAVLGADIVDANATPSSAEPHLLYLRVLLSAIAFLLPVTALAVAARAFQRAKLPCDADAFVFELTDASLSIGQFGELGRVLRANSDELPDLAENVLGTVFSPAVTHATTTTGSLLVPELLADTRLVQALPDPRGAVLLLTRELLGNKTRSPLRFEVLETVAGRGGDYILDPLEHDLFGRTFGFPPWYATVYAEHALQELAFEALLSGRFDERYNQLGLGYFADVGRQERADCPIYLSLTAQLLAVKAAVISRTPHEVDADRLGWLFVEILKHSHFRSDVWEAPTANLTHPTPYAYLLSRIIVEIERLFSIALRRSSEAEDETPPRERLEWLLAAAEGRESGGHAPLPSWRVLPPTTTMRWLLSAWAHCTTALLQSKGQVSESFKGQLAVRYFMNLIRMHDNPAAITHAGLPAGAPGLDVWIAEAVRMVASMRHDVGLLLNEFADPVETVDGLDWLLSRLETETGG